MAVAVDLVGATIAHLKKKQNYKVINPEFNNQVEAFERLILAYPEKDQAKVIHSLLFSQEIHSLINFSPFNKLKHEPYQYLKLGIDEMI